MNYIAVSLNNKSLALDTRRNIEVGTKFRILKDFSHGVENLMI
jgi:hypothetical protein